MPSFGRMKRAVLAFVASVASAGSLHACASSRENGFASRDLPADGSGPGTFNPTGSDGAVTTPCKGLECAIVHCGTGTTTLTGRVYAPTPKQFGQADPIYNAIVYVPNAELHPFPRGVTCDKCGTVTSGEPVVTALSAPDGTFVLENVPAGDDIPLVIQIGRWRRRVTIAHVDACKTTELAPEQTRLPRNKTEGDIPQMAVVTSPFDPTECILRKIGIDETEFTPPSEDGRVHVYKGGGATLENKTPPDAATLWASVENLSRYDLVALPCHTYTLHKPTTEPELANVVSYADMGGRIFITDYSRDIITNANEWKTTATFNTSFQNPARIDTSFFKGEAFAKWLAAVDATSLDGELELEQVTSGITALGPKSQRWIYGANNAIETYSFNTPLAAEADNQCGRVVYSGFHIATIAGPSFPSECGKAPLTAQEKTLEFMLFDLASCIQRDDEEPAPPKVK